MGELLAGLIGAVVALLGQGIHKRWRDAIAARAVAIALWEELAAVQFGSSWFEGFSSDTFDMLFREVAHVLPEDLFRAVVRYHWKMKFLEGMKSPGAPSQNSQWWRGQVDLARGQLDALHPRLHAYANQPVLRLFLTRRERTALRPSPAKSTD